VQRGVPRVRLQRRGFGEVNVDGCPEAVDEAVPAARRTAKGV
jgi:hypothetical protein